MKWILLPVAAFCIPALHAQDNILDELRTQKPGQGTVTIHPPREIAALVGKPAQPDSITGKRGTLKATGYRVQIYAGNNSRQAKEEAFRIGAQVKEFFPDLAVYAHFASPRWLCRVGDYKSIEEADAMMRQLKATEVFKEVSIVKDIINIQL